MDPIKWRERYASDSDIDDEVDIDPVQYRLTPQQESFVNRGSMLFQNLRDQWAKGKRIQTLACAQPIAGQNSNNNNSNNNTNNSNMNTTTSSSSASSNTSSLLSSALLPDSTPRYSTRSRSAQQMNQQNSNSINSSHDATMNSLNNVSSQARSHTHRRHHSSNAVQSHSRSHSRHNHSTDVNGTSSSNCSDGIDDCVDHDDSDGSDTSSSSDSDYESSINVPAIMDCLRSNEPFHKRIKLSSMIDILTVIWEDELE
jgi:hypothetical protein